MNQKGQGLIEFIFGFATLAAVLKGLFVGFYLIYANQAAKNEIYKTALCLEEFKLTKYRCKKESLSRLRTLLFFHNNLNLSIHSTSSTHHVKASGCFIKTQTWKKTLKKT